jgi:hypothetical protein
MDLDNIPLDDAEAIQGGMISFGVITGYEYTGEEERPIWWEGEVLAYTLQDVEFILNFTGIPHVDTPYFIGAVDASEVSNRFDPTNN